MMVVGIWLLTFLDWLMPAQKAVSFFPRASTPAFVPAWPLRERQPMTRLAPIPHPAHRRRL